MISKIDHAKCNGCALCTEICIMDVLRLNTSLGIKEISPCQEGCPAGTNIRGFIYLINQGKIAEARQMIKESLPFPAITGRICFHPCETKCARQDVDSPVNINALERFIADFALEPQAGPLPRTQTAKVAIVGAGPAGLSAAYFLRRKGYGVTIFEAMPAPGGMLIAGIPQYRLPRDILDTQINNLRNMGIEFKIGITIGKDISTDDLKDRGYKAIVYAIGCQLSTKINIEGSNLNGVFWGMDFLRTSNLNGRVEIKDRVLVIGGGNVAIDAALTALRRGARQVELACLESREEMPAHKECLQQALDEGISISASWGPKRIAGRDGAVKGMELVRCSSVFDKKGKFNPCFEQNTQKFIEADTVILAIGQTADLSLLPKGATNNAGGIAADPLTLQLGIPSIFACGDVVSGPTSVVEAVASGKRVAESVDCYFKGEKIKKKANSGLKRIKEPPQEGVEPKARQETPFLPAEERQKNFREIKTGFSEEMALDEAQRCMACGSKAFIAYPEDCQLCYQCELECPQKAIEVSFSPIKRPLVIAYRKDGSR